MAKDRSKGSSRKKTKRNLRRYLIVSEDARSSLDYFKSFPHDKDKVEIVPFGGAGNTRFVVQRGIEMQEEATRNKEPYVHVYCVFDRDDHEAKHYAAAFDLAHSHNDLTAVWANECYELWLMLHFKFHNTAIGRKDIYKFLKKALGCDYEKGKTKAYDLTKDKIETAICHSKKLLEYAEDQNLDSPWQVNPSTNIHDLVEKLIELNQLQKV
jgi:hypothetical protein